LCATDEVKALIDAADARQIATGDGWRDLVLPDGAAKAGYAISFNIVVRRPDGTHTVGKDHDGKVRVIKIDNKSYLTHVLACASFHGPPPREGDIVLHKDDNYQDVTVDMLRWGTVKQNNIEARGRATVVKGADGVSRTFATIGEAAACIGMKRCALLQRFEAAGQPPSLKVNGYIVAAAPTKRRRTE
jgi:hypothetical protein